MSNLEDSDIFAPDAMLPSQLFAPRNGLSEPERALMVAVLEDAVRCLLNHCRAADSEKRELYRSAIQWFRSTDRHELYTFESVCIILGLEPTYVRRRLFAERDRRLVSAPSIAPRSHERESGALNSSFVRSAAPGEGSTSVNSPGTKVAPAKSSRHGGGR